jgi:hypothetical protein
METVQNGFLIDESTGTTLLKQGADEIAANR